MIPHNAGSLIVCAVMPQPTCFALARWLLLDKARVWAGLQRVPSAPCWSSGTTAMMPAVRPSQPLSTARHTCTTWAGKASSNCRRCVIKCWWVERRVRWRWTCGWFCRVGSWLTTRPPCLTQATAPARFCQLWAGHRWWRKRVRLLRLRLTLDGSWMRTRRRMRRMIRAQTRTGSLLRRIRKLGLKHRSLKRRPRWRIQQRCLGLEKSWSGGTRQAGSCSTSAVSTRNSVWPCGRAEGTGVATCVRSAGTSLRSRPLLLSSAATCTSTPSVVFKPVKTSRTVCCPWFLLRTSQT